MVKKNRTAKTRIDAPKGFVEVGNSMSGFWKPTIPGQSLQGVVGRMIETEGAEGKTNRFYSVRITDVARTGPIVSGDDDDATIEKGDVVGVGGAVLLSFLEDHEGKEVFLVYKGLGEKKKGKNQAKLYATYAKGGKASADEESDDIPF